MILRHRVAYLGPLSESRQASRGPWCRLGHRAWSGKGTSK